MESGGENNSVGKNKNPADFVISCHDTATINQAILTSSSISLAGMRSKGFFLFTTSNAHSLG